MKAIKCFLLSLLFVSTSVFAQEKQPEERQLGHTNNNKFKQLYDEFSSPNMFRTASGAPGPAYYQQQADYKMDIEIDGGVSDKTIGQILEAGANLIVSASYLFGAENMEEAIDKLRI